MARQAKLQSFFRTQFQLIFIGPIKDNGIVWEECDGGLLIVRRGIIKPSGEVRIAGFDLDETLIRTKKGLTHAKDADDWQFWNDHVVGILRRVKENGYQPVIFTNQNGLKLWPSKKTIFRRKIHALLHELDIEGIIMYAATEKNYYRKPDRGMWERLRQDLNVSIDYERSFFVGDAAGRPHNHELKQHADHSSADKDFAANIGITFYTPNEFFHPDLELDRVTRDADDTLSPTEI